MADFLQVQKRVVIVTTISVKNCINLPPVINFHSLVLNYLLLITMSINKTPKSDNKGTDYGYSGWLQSETFYMVTVCNIELSPLQGINWGQTP